MSPIWLEIVLGFLVPVGWGLRELYLLRRDRLRAEREARGTHPSPDGQTGPAADAGAGASADVSAGAAADAAAPQPADPRVGR